MKVKKNIFSFKIKYSDYIKKNKNFNKTVSDIHYYLNLFKLKGIEEGTIYCPITWILLLKRTSLFKKTEYSHKLFMCLKGNTFDSSVSNYFAFSDFLMFVVIISCFIAIYFILLVNISWWFISEIKMCLTLGKKRCEYSF